MTMAGMAFGRYELVGTLGQGGFATVYRAWDPALGRPVALKALLPHLAADPELHARFLAAAKASVAAYTELLAALESRFADEPNATLRRKQARQAARSVLPNATETRVVVTGNYRAWRHFVAMRATEHADVEIRALAVECLRQLHKAAPNVFADFEISSLGDGTEIASSPYVTEG